MTGKRIVVLAGLFALVVLVGYAPSAKADTVRFSCDSVDSASPPCTGTIASAGGNFSSTGVSVFNITGQYPITTVFTLTFNTATGAIQLTNGTDTLTGTITSFTSEPGFFTGLTTISANVAWTSLPAAVCAPGAAPCAGIGVFSSVTFIINSGTADVVHIAIQPIPEPGTMALFGTGLVALGGALRRKISGLISRC